jgi:hypothetical protein
MAQYPIGINAFGADPLVSVLLFKLRAKKNSF